MIFQNSFNIMIEVSKHKSFTKAASKLGISGAAVSKQIKILEDRLQLVLFNRTTRVVTLTDAGEQLFEALNRSEDEITAVIRKITHGLEQPTGKLRINAPMAFGERFLVDVITDYAKQYPGVILDIDFDDKQINIIEEGYDLVIRIGKLDNSGLIARRISDFPVYVCASPSLIKQYGMPLKPDDLKEIPSVVYKNYKNSNLTFKNKKTNEETTISSNPVIYTNTLALLLNSTLKGIGLCRLPAVFCRDKIKTGELLTLLPDYTMVPDRGVYAIYPDRRYLPMKVKLFIDAINNQLKSSDI
jgi:DNA-binding transcriptional LysR family regulator